MQSDITLNVNGETHHMVVDPETPLLYVLRNDLRLVGAKYGCGLEQCNACNVLIDGANVPSCQIPVRQVQGTTIVTLEGLSDDGDLHPLQEAFLEEQAGQCGYCTAGMIVAAQGLLNRVRYPSDEQIREAMHDNLCRCGTYDRVRRAIKLRIGRPEWDPIYEVINVESPDDGADASAELPSSIQRAPDLDNWIRFNADETVTVFTGKAEIGQGIKTAIAMIAAEELDVTLDRVRVVTADTHQTQDEGVVSGSMSVQISGSALRQAAAEARYILLKTAVEHLESELPIESLEVEDGTITDPQTRRSVSYWTLTGGKRFGQQIAGIGRPKSPQDYKIVGKPEKRIDLLSKVSGGISYVHDMTLPDMLHARVVRPPNYHARLVSADVDVIRQMPGVIDVVHNGSFLAVLAKREEQAIFARDALAQAAIWEQDTPLPDQDALYTDLVNDASESILIKDGIPVDDPIPPIAPPDDAVRTLTATYYRPYHMHGSLGPSAAMALLADNMLTIWSHTQGAFNLRAAVAQALNLEPDAVRVIHTEGAGCYGHNGADDAGFDAALLALAVPGRPVLLKWSREDEHCWEPYSSAMVMKVQASLDAEGTVCDWNHDVWSYIHSTRPRPVDNGSLLLAAWHLEEPQPPPPSRLIKSPQFGSQRNADPKYAFRRQRIVKHFVPDSPLRVSAMRSLGAYANVFAIESFVDELAFAAGVDPVEFRLRHMEDARSRAVIEAAAEKAGWQPRTQPSGSGHGRGFAFSQYKNRACYVAMVVDVDVDRDSGEIKLGHCVIAADSGQIVNPDGLSNQIEGGFVQAASWTLYEQVTYKPEGICSVDWETYPILRFSNAPQIKTVLLNRANAPFIGAGEASQCPTPAAIANAVFDAVGIRLREIPFTPERVKAGLAQQQ